MNAIWTTKNFVIFPYHEFKADILVYEEDLEEFVLKRTLPMRS